MNLIEDIQRKTGVRVEGIRLVSGRWKVRAFARWIDLSDLLKGDICF